MWTSGGQPGISSDPQMVTLILDISFLTIVTFTA